MDMIKFRKASRKDNKLVTVNLSDLDNVADVINHSNRNSAFVDLPKDAEFILTIAGVRTIFFVNREGKTAASYAFPRHLRLPAMGRPTYASVDNIAEQV